MPTSLIKLYIKRYTYFKKYSVLLELSKHSYLSIFTILTMSKVATQPSTIYYTNK